MIPGDIPQWIVLTWLFVFGAAIGSFLNVCIYRLPRRERLLEAWRGMGHPPSSCPYCSTRIRWHDNIPIFSWLGLRGRCRVCRHRIPFRYLLIELLNGLLVAGLYWVIVPAGFTAKISESCLWTHIGPLADPQLPHSVQVWTVNLQFLYYLVLAEALLVASFIDFDLQIIPDSVTVPGMIVGFGGALAFPRLWLTTLWLNPYSVPEWIGAHPRLHAAAVSVAGALVAAGLIKGVQVIGRRVLRREAMGEGDVILMAMIGSYIGWQASVLVFFLAPMCALAVIAGQWLFRRVYVIPYGPYLSLGTLIVLLGWQPIWGRLEHVFRLGPWLGLYVAVMGVLLFLSLMLVQGVKWLLGIPLYPEDFGEWTSADQLSFFTPYERQTGNGALTNTKWPGIAASRGQRQWQSWRHGSG
jgi:leader peptidase (prepilin peptidase)/N-methyltransferase